MANLGNGAANGQFNKQVTQVTGVTTYAVQPTDEFVQVTTGTPAVNVTLPASVAAGSYVANSNPASSTLGAVGTVGLQVTIQKIDSGAGAVNVLGNLNIGLGFALASKWSSATFVNDGVKWNLTGTVS